MIVCIILWCSTNDMNQWIKDAHAHLHIHMVMITALKSINNWTSEWMKNNSQTKIIKVYVDQNTEIHNRTRAERSLEASWRPQLHGGSACTGRPSKNTPICVYSMLIQTVVSHFSKLSILLKGIWAWGWSFLSHYTPFITWQCTG